MVPAILLIAAAACASDSGGSLAKGDTTQKQSSQSEVAAVQGSKLHERRPSQIDSVIRDFTLDSTTISFGTLFYWTNLDDATHRVVSGTPGAPTGLWDSGDLNKGDSFRVDFLLQGRFDYFCSIHPHMRGSIRVLHATNNSEEKGFHM